MTLFVKMPDWEATVKEVATAYYKLILIVGPTASGKTTLLKEAASYNFSFLNLGEELSRRLLSRPAYLRAAEAEEATIELVHQVGGARMAIDNTEALFEPPIQLNPLALLKRLSIHRTVVATWNGHFDESRLMYGSKEHPAYREFKYTKEDSFIIVPSDPTA
jgi:hypothetical protein